MSVKQIQCSFMRGGTSRGLFFSAPHLAPYSQNDRDKIICQAMGSPDPGGRQIDGLGGGISSLSKSAMISAPGCKMVSIARRAKIPLPGVEWADDPKLFKDKEKGWDAVYRFGQVPIRETTEIDYSSTCGNLVAAAAQFAIESGKSRMNELINASFPEACQTQKLDRQEETKKIKYSFPLRLLAANIGKVIVVKVPLIGKFDPRSPGFLNWSLATQGTARIAGVPGYAPPILVEDPLDSSSILPTQNQVDTIEVEGHKVDVTIINAGLPTIFVSTATKYLDLSQQLLLSQPSVLDASPLMPKLQRIREEVCRSNNSGLVLSPSAPKICLVAPRTGYLSTEGVQVAEKDMDCLVRAVSVGNIHRTIPATALAALACGLAFPKSVIYQAVKQSGSEATNLKETDGEKSLTISVGQPSGVSRCSISTARSGNEIIPKATRMLRTARTIMRGSVDVPEGLEFDPDFVKEAERTDGPGWYRSMY